MARNRTSPLSIIVIALFLSACQSTMSIEEAKKVTTQFAGSPFVPPPRTIEDITAILDQQKRADPRAAEAARARADQSPPETTDASVLTKFYYERGLAAREIGRAKQEIEDLSKALSYAGSNHEILFELSMAELQGGTYSRSIDYRRKAIAAVPWNQRGWLIPLNSGLASMYASWGDLQAAEAALAETLRVFSESQSWQNLRPEWIAGYRAGVAQGRAAILEAKGQYAEAEALYRQAAAALATDAMRSKQPWLDLQHSFIARTLIHQGRLLEAENEARKALLGALTKRGRYANHTAWMLRSLVWVIQEQGRYREAETLARAVVDIYEKTGSSSDSLFLAGVRGQLATALQFQRRYREALEQYEVVRAGLSGDPEYLSKFLGGHVGYAVALLRTGKPDQALEILDGALAKSRRLVGDRHRNTAQIRAYMAQAYAAKDDRLRALQEFREAIPVLLSGSFEGNDEATTRIAADLRLAGILTGYIELLADITGTGLERETGIDAAAEAFRLAEVVRGRSVERALDASAARAAAKTPALADLVRREQDAKKQIGALQSLLSNALSAPSDQQDPRVVENLRSQIDTLRRARQSLFHQIEREFPAYAQLVNPAPATLEQARASLRPGEALISTLVGWNRTFVWAIPQTGPVAFAAVPLNASGLEARVAALRKALDPSAKTLGEIPEFDVALAHDLYRALLEPVSSGWQQAESLLVVPHGPLGQLPFSLLVTRPAALGPEQGALFSRYREVPWLARRYAVTQLPSVGALATLRRLPPSDPSRRPFLGFGDPYFSPEQARRAAREPAQVQVAGISPRSAPVALRNLKIVSRNSTHLAMLPRLPETAEEIRSIARVLGADPNRDVFLGERASEETVKRLDLSAYRVLAFATHGLVPGDLDGLTQPALALTAPEVAKAEGDGLLTMEEILGLRLNADWVVLSACNTASGQGAGAEAISGLGRAFFYAGARALLVSHWPVETTSALALTTDLFRRQTADPRLTRARALQRTMNWLIDEGQFVNSATRQTVFSYAHPLFWAPFTLVGDSGGDMTVR